MISSPLVGKTAQTGFQRIAGSILGNPTAAGGELADALRCGKGLWGGRVGIGIRPWGSEGLGRQGRYRLYTASQVSSPPHMQSSGGFIATALLYSDQNYQKGLLIACTFVVAIIGFYMGPYFKVRVSYFKVPEMPTGSPRIRDI